MAPVQESMMCLALATEVEQCNKSLAVVLEPGTIARGPCAAASIVYMLHWPVQASLYVPLSRSMHIPSQLY